MEASNEFTQYEPSRLVSFKVTADSVTAQGWYVVEPAGAGHTKLTSRIEMGPSGLTGLAQPLMAASLSREVVANLSELKGLLEAKVKAPSVQTGDWAERHPA